MRKSSRFVVAVHILTLLAHPGAFMTSEELARSINTNPVVVRRILALLARDGLVYTKEGASGGVCLTLSPGSIDLGMVYEAVESESIFALHPQPPNQACPVGSAIWQAVTPTILAAEKALRRALTKTTVAGVLRRVREKSS